ncbi:divisome-associated lipoprotein YraP [Thalassotalea sp. LPB0316]|uniref:division/outer membrane stress-associated lipid-binding lipoprotein n=1 Tax=Thalassotalea sp. LPB0316 TaxID=2769490 RepID=UPI0018664BCD|nr:division/outer membrane stress-associated lipid-binding lipoprotein [Thalassotalea sp. LPB0316]QOL25979.1 divisome-associated lipoprotein YraP [Thalassotalea sp. LPB0316]
MKYNQLIIVCTLLTLLQGCVAATVAGVVGGVMVAKDNRTVGQQIDDQNIEIKAMSEISKQDALSNGSRIKVVSVNGRILVVGQAKNEYVRDLAIKTINNITGVKQVYNQLRIGNEISMTTRSNDAWLTSKVKTNIFSDKNIDATKVKVVTENGEVFLMGLIHQEQADIAVEIARNVSGVNRVFKAFEYL